MQWAYIRIAGLARSANAQQDRAEEQRYAIAPAFTSRPDAKTNLRFSYSPE